MSGLKEIDNMLHRQMGYPETITRARQIISDLEHELRTIRTALVKIPDGYTLRNGGVLCDALVGHCACGAAHSIEEIGKRLADAHNTYKLGPDGR